ncbi:hypothetical protein ZWY2020_006470 [Hordeum vulgare]|nr:hypothetical protein ZWY2020_006470 [Hordeum vulgare]
MPHPILTHLPSIHPAPLPFRRSSIDRTNDPQLAALPTGATPELGASPTAAIANEHQQELPSMVAGLRSLCLVSCLPSSEDVIPHPEVADPAMHAPSPASSTLHPTRHRPLLVPSVARCLLHFAACSCHPLVLVRPSHTSSSAPRKPLCP